MKKLFLLPLVAMFGLVGCGGDNPGGEGGGGGGGGGTHDPVVLTSANLLGYEGTTVAYNAEEASKTVDGIEYKYIQLAAYSDEDGAIRNRTKDGQGSYLFNTTAFSAPIKSIALKLSSKKQVYDNTDVWSFKFGTSASALGDEVKLSTVADTLEYSVSAVGSPTFFRMDKIITSYSFYIDSITINF